MIGRPLSHYRILEKLGQGGMGEVFLALDTRLDRKVAIKLLPEELRKDPSARKRLLREAKSAAILDHPFICKVYEADECDDHDYIAMEYIEGRTLQDRLVEGPLPLGDLIHVATEVAEALQVAHDHGIVHRDLKPANVMLGRSGHIKVMDFGVAKLVGLPADVDAQTASTSLTARGAIVGTIDYMAPEQLRGQEVDARSDIFAFGIVLYELLTGSHPFRKSSVAETAHAILSDDPISIQNISGISSLLNHLIRKALARNPSDRYQSFRDLMADLRLVRAEGSRKEGRCLEAIMVTDIAGYGAAIQRNEALAMQLLEEHWRLLRPIFPRHNGQEIKTIGDGFLVEFSSALQATQCAIDIQQTLAERNSTVPPDRRIELRIGLHLGDVLRRDNDVFGDGVNFASLIKPLSEPGGICISEDVAHQVRNKIEFPLVEIVDKPQLEEIERPLRVFRLALPWVKTPSIPGARAAVEAGPAGQPSAAGQLSAGKSPAAPPAMTGSKSEASAERGWGWLPVSRSRQWLLGFAAALTLVASVILILWTLSPRPVLSFSARDWILISDFENETGNQMFDKSLGTAFSVSMAQSRHANVFPKSRMPEVLKRMGKQPDVAVDEQVGLVVCVRERIRGLICPSIGKVGNRFVLTARIVDPRTGGAVRSYAEQAADEDHILPALDAVAASVRKGLGESFSQIEVSNMPLARVTTPSLQALKSYSEALVMWGKGEYESALELQQSAVKQDPDFAMAHAALGVYFCSFVFNNQPEGKAHFEKALSVADRTTDRERQSIRLEYESNFGTFETARNLYDVYLSSYPDGVAQRYNYGNLLRDHGEIDKAIEQFTEVLRVAPNWAGAHINLATCYSLQDRSQEALSSYDRAFQLEPSWVTSGNLNHEYGFTLASAGDFAKARQVFSQALASASMKPNALRSLALLDLYQGKYRDAKPKLQEALLLNASGKATLSEARNHLFMSILLDGQGDLAGSQGELDKAATCLRMVPPVTWLSARLGVGYARGRSTEKAARIQKEIQEKLNPNDSQQNSDLHRLEGELQLALGNPVKATGLLLLADREQRSPLTLESLARAQQIAGKPDDAISSYEALLGMRSQAHGWEAQQPWFAAHVQLARLYLARRQQEKALRVLGQFLALWKGADPDLPLNKDAHSLEKTLSATGR
ncbi:MAG: protein kinase [Acidobacteriia bacterium]|nr:protein kinase [Terriglobia bacterium]